MSPPGNLSQSKLESGVHTVREHGNPYSSGVRGEVSTWANVHMSNCLYKPISSLMLAGNTTTPLERPALPCHSYMLLSIYTLLLPLTGTTQWISKVTRSIHPVINVYNMSLEPDQSIQ